VLFGPSEWLSGHVNHSNSKPDINDNNNIIIIMVIIIITTTTTITTIIMMMMMLTSQQPIITVLIDVQLGEQQLWNLHAVRRWAGRQQSAHVSVLAATSQPSSGNFARYGSASGITWTCVASG